MMSPEQNDYLTRVAPGQPAGKLLRQYWMPIALTDELEGERPVVPVELMGERLVLFRNENGELGLIQRQCPHRGADLCYGRLEDGGLRCLFHGWLFDREGQCLEQPAEPEGSQMHQKIRARSYPVREVNGAIFAWLGGSDEADAPPLPDLDCLRAPTSHVFAFKGLWHCNWLQALEVGIDPAHASFLHRFLEDEDPADSYGKQFRDSAADTEIPMTRLLRDYPRPRIEVEETDFGMRLLALRELDDSRTHVRVTNQIFPCAISIPMSREMNIIQWHVPVSDTECYWFSMFVSYGEPVNHAKMREQRLLEHSLPAYAPLKHSGNRYGYDIAEQRSKTYTGMGSDINVHDQWACESMGAIQDRTDEHLGRTDVGITRYRRKLKAMIDAVCADRLDEVRDGAIAAAMARGPRAVDAIASTADWQTAWAASDEARRKAASWDAGMGDA